MQFEPTLIVKRVVINKVAQRVYDEKFHEGVNIIRGENSSGKSTILNFIFYGLGGDLADWSASALLCTSVTLEVDLNGHPATLRREISTKSGQPMQIFGGTYEQSENAPITEWIRYPYARSTSLESFSQALFRLLKIPEVTSDASGNITINQILRLLYADQLSPVDKIFRHQGFDSPVMRDAIGRLLCGAYDSQLYDNEQTIKFKQRQLDTISGELKGLLNALGVEHSLTIEWLDAERVVLNEKKKSVLKEITDAEAKYYADESRDQISLDAQLAAYAEVQSYQEMLSSKQQEKDSLSLAIADSSLFIASLEQKISALTDTALVAEVVTEISFHMCPACYVPIEANDVSPHACHLCKNPFDSDQAQQRITALINDSAIQLKQSLILQEKRNAKIGTLNRDYAELEMKWKNAAEKLTSLQSLPSSASRHYLNTLNRQSGYIDRELENLEEKGKLIAAIHDLSQSKETLSTEIATLRAQNETMRTAQAARLSKAYTAIADELKSLLHADLRRQDTFENPQHIGFSFEGDEVTVDGQSYFSASSRAILRNSFFLGFFAAATKNATFRHPRFCMLDTIEDKGVEVTRSHNFQNQIKRISDETSVRHQIIYATAMISPDLDDLEYTIGKFSTRDDPTLNFNSANDLV